MSIEKALELEKAILKHKEELSNLEGLIEMKEASIYVLESEIADIELKIAKLEKTRDNMRLLNFSKEKDVLTGDEFKDSFIRASQFADRAFEKKEFYKITQYVQIKEDELIALNGVIGIVIKCNSIPEELKNSYIKWDVREDFKDHKLEDEKIPHSKFNHQEFFGKTLMGRSWFTTNMKDLYKKYAVETRSWRNGGELTVFDIEGVIIAANNNFLSLAKDVYKDCEFDFLYPKSALHTLVMENETHKVFICPIRL